MFDYSPKLPELIFYPFFAGLSALGIARAFPSDEANLFLGAVCVNCAFVASFYLYRESCQYVDAATPSQTTTPKLLSLDDERPIQASLQRIPQTMSGGQPVYSQSMELVSVNAVKAFNQHIITQYSSGLPVVLTENYWTKKETGMDQSRWVRIGGSGPTDWKDMMSRGLKWGAYKTEGGQDKRVIGNIRKVSQLAQGYPLPTWDELKKMENSLAR